MPKGYWIAHVTVTDPEQYEQYKTATQPVFAKWGARMLARGGAFEEMEGPQGRERHVVIEFASLADAIACYRSDEYAAAMALRAGAGDAYIVIVEGVG